MKAIVIATLMALALALVGCATNHKPDTMGDKHHGMMMTMMSGGSSMKCKMCAGKGSQHDHSTNNPAEKAPAGHVH